MARYSLLLCLHCVCFSYAYGQVDSYEDFQLGLQGKGRTLVDEVRKNNGLLAKESIAKSFMDKIIGDCFEESPVDFLIARDFYEIDAALIEMRAETESPLVIVIYRKTYKEANPQFLERSVRWLGTNRTFAFKVSYEDFSQLASIYVVGGAKLQIFDVCKSDGKFGVFKRDANEVQKNSP